MNVHRSNSDHPPAAPEPMRAEDVRRMLAGREVAPRPPRQQRSIRRTLALTLMSFAAYVLSIGPLYWKWYAAKVGLGTPIYILLYRPLEKLAEWIPPLGHFLNWYISLWIY